MIQLDAFGRFQISRDGGDPLEALLSQPKRAALFAYLVLVGESRFPRRDTLLPLFWPESDESRARAALSQALSFLRRELGSGVVITRGPEEVGIGPLVVSDVVRFERAVACGEWRTAVELYSGELLPGLHVAGAPAFTDWLDRKRESLRVDAVRAATAWVDEAQGEAGMENALVAARRAVELDPFSERSVQRLMRVLHGSGDRAGAVRTYQQFRDRLRAELEIEPSAATQDLSERMSREDSSPSPGPSTTEQGVSAGLDGTRSRAGPAATGGRVGAGVPDSTAGDRRGGRTVTSRRARMTGVALLALGALLPLWAVGIFGGPAASTGGDNAISMAVLPPLENGTLPAEAALAAGLHLEIIARLWRVPGLRVLPRQSVMRYADHRTLPAEMAADLEVPFVLDLTLVGLDGGTRLGVQLVDVRSGELIWAGTFECGTDMASMYGLQDELARNVVLALDLPGFEPPAAHTVPELPTQDLEAYESYLRGRAIEWRGRHDDLFRAEALFERATRRDSTFAEAWAALGRLRSYMLFFGVMERPLWSSEEPLQRAVELAPDAVETHWGLVGLRITTSDYAAALAHIDRLWELEPGNPDVEYLRGMIAMWEGRWEEAVAHLLRSGEMDPGGVRAPFEAALVQLRLGRMDHADRTFDRVLELDPGMPWAWVWRSVVPIKRDGDMKTARARLRQALDRVDPWLVLMELSKPKAAELRPYARILLDDLRPALEDDATRAALRAACRSCDLSLQALLLERAGRPVIAAAYHDSLRIHFDTLAARSDEFGTFAPLLWSWLGLERAYAGDREGALAAVRRAAERVPLERDAYKGTIVLETLAAVHVLTGDFDAAVDVLEQVLAVPSDLSPAVLRLDPIWEPLHPHARFRRLLER